MNATKFLFCCVRFVYTYPTKQARCSVPDPTPPFVQGAGSYAYIPHGAFVALEIFGGVFVCFLHWFGLFSECYKLAGWHGLKACAKYLCGALSLDDYEAKSSDFSMGGCDG